MLAWPDRTPTLISPDDAPEPEIVGHAAGVAAAAELYAQCRTELYRRLIGRQPHFRSLQRQYAGILNALLARGARARPTCGLHFHLLTPSLAEPAPEIECSIRSRWVSKSCGSRSGRKYRTSSDSSSATFSVPPTGQQRNTIAVYSTSSPLE